MTAATSLEKQIERYRLMTGEQRLAVALERHEMSCGIAWEAIRRQNPHADEVEVERLLRQRRQLANLQKQKTEMAIATKLVPTHVAASRQSAAL